MGRRRLSRSRLLAASPVLALAVLLGLWSAPSASADSGGHTGRWRVVAKVGPADGVTYPDFFATSGPDNAWSWWRGCAPCAATDEHYYTLLRRWNGTRWLSMSVPAATRGIAGLSVSSADNAWIFAVSTHRGHPAEDHVLIWNGKSWRYQKIPDWVIGFSRAGFYYVYPVVFGPDDVWAFSVGAYASHYNGRTWAKIKMPYTAGSVISPVSANDIWAMDYSPTGSQGLMHWNGVSWQRLSIPKASHIPAKSTEYVSDLLATGPRSVWLVRDIETGEQGARSLYLMHWDGSIWQHVRFAYRTSFVDQTARDGAGGLWMAANGPAPAYRWYFVHLQEDGTWTRQVVPAGSQISNLLVQPSLLWVPGTQSLWAVGNFVPPKHNEARRGAIFRFGA